MKTLTELTFAFFVSSLGIFFSTGAYSADLKVSGTTGSPQVSFAVAELKTVCSELAVGDSDISVLFEKVPRGSLSFAKAVTSFTSKLQSTHSKTRSKNGSATQI